MNRISSPARWATIGLLAATLALAGCGRKGGLDLPPQASSYQAPASAAPAVDTEAEAAATKGSVFDPTYGTERGPAAAKGRKKPFILDPILD